MPKANENLTEATLDRWLVKEGESVRVNQSLCEIITDKAKFEMPSPAAGRVLKILGPERALLPVGYVMCVIGNEGEIVGADVAQKNEALLAAHRAAATSLSATAAPASTAPSVAASGIRATPSARRLAKEKGIDLADVVTKLNLTTPVNDKDIQRYLEQR